MKQIFCLFFICLLLLAACKKDHKPDFEITGFDPGKGAYNLHVTINGNGFDTLISNTKVAFNGADAIIISVSETAIVAAVPVNATTGKISVTINNQAVRSAADFVILPGKWIQKGMLPPDKGRLVGLGFTVGSKGYMATGERIGFYVPNSDRLNDMMEYDPATGIWREKSPLTGLKLSGGLGMAINNKIYLGVGATDQGLETNQFWEYDPITDKWTRKADFPGDLRKYGIGFSAGGKGYAGTGLYNGVSGLKDWWQYDPVANTWSRKTDFPGKARHFFTGFVLNNKIYTGIGPASDYRDWWEYDAATDAWTRKKDFPGRMDWGAYGFTIANRGYIMAAGSECWEYVPATDSWVQQAFFAPRYMGVAFSIGNKGYYITGTTGINSAAGALVDEVWEFTPTP